MNRSCKQRLLPAVVLLAASSAPVASALAADSRPHDPADPAAATAPLRYVSPFETYRETRPGAATGWVEANREVAAIGGWRAYAREAQEPEPAASAAAELRTSTATRPKAPPLPTKHDHGSHTPGVPR